MKSLLGPLAERVIHVISRDYDRSEGMAAYIAENGVEDYVILDDRPDWFALGTPRLVVCDFQTGIDNENVLARLLDWLKSSGSAGTTRRSKNGHCNSLEVSAPRPSATHPSGSYNKVSCFQPVLPSLSECRPRRRSECPDHT